MTSTQSSRESSCESDSRGSSTPSKHSDSQSPVLPNINGPPDVLRSHVLASPKASDAECWESMLALQKEYHCYHSARLEAAVDALENGWLIEDVPMPSRLCLDLLNEGLKAQLQEFEAIQNGSIR